jgi:hypothetical protein
MDLADHVDKNNTRRQVMGNGSIKGKVWMEIADHEFQRLQKHYFDGQTATTFTNSNKTISCGSEILDSYKGTDTTRECVAIAGSDAEISAADLFVHHALKKKLIPANLSGQIVAAPNGTDAFVEDDEDVSGSSVFVGLPLIKWLMKKEGITVTGKPKKVCYEDNKACTNFDDIHYGANAVSAKNKDFRKFAYPGNNFIEASKVFNRFVKSALALISGNE